jgi:DNA-binding CsgD family transcriptional regulator
MCVTDLEASASLPEQHLREVFSLTAAERRVALSLLEGLEPQQIARRLDVGLPTGRTHLAHTFEKTGTT